MAKLSFDEMADQGLLKGINSSTFGVGRLDLLHQCQGVVAVFETSQARVDFDIMKSSVSPVSASQRPRIGGTFLFYSSCH